MEKDTVILSLSEYHRLVDEAKVNKGELVRFELNSYNFYGGSHDESYYLKKDEFIDVIQKSNEKLRLKIFKLEGKLSETENEAIAENKAHNKIDDASDSLKSNWIVKLLKLK